MSTTDTPGMKPLNGPSGQIPDDLIGTTEAAALGPSPYKGRKRCRGTIRAWIFKGKLRGWTDGYHYFVSKSEVLALFGVIPVAPDPVQVSRKEAVERAKYTDRVLRERGLR